MRFNRLWKNLLTIAEECGKKSCFDLIKLTIKLISHLVHIQFTIVVTTVIYLHYLAIWLRHCMFITESAPVITVNLDKTEVLLSEYIQSI